MPNWVINEVTVIPVKTNASYQDMISKITTDENIDFNKIIPMPEELNGTTSPARIISEEDYLLQKIREEEGEKIFAKGITKEMSNDFIKKYKYNNWYDWARNFWGTKWNARNSIIEDFFFSFETAWSMPKNIFIALSKQFPEFRFAVNYADEDLGYNCGEITFENGEVVGLSNLEGGSVEAYNKAFDLWGSSIENYEGYAEEDLKDELLDNGKPTSFFLAIINRELEKQEFIGQTKEIMNMALKVFAELEDYETAEKIKKYLE